MHSDKCRRFKAIHVGYSKVLDIFKGLVKLEGIPDGSEIMFVYHDDSRLGFRVIIYHPDFESVPEGFVFPDLDVSIKTWYDKPPLL